MAASLPGVGQFLSSSTAIASVFSGGKKTSTTSEPSYVPGDAAHEDFDAIDLHDAFGGLAEKRDLRHPAAKSIEPRLAAPGHRRQHNMLGTDQRRAGRSARSAVSPCRAQVREQWRSARFRPARRAPKSAPRKRLLRPTNVATKALFGCW